MFNDFKGFDEEGNPIKISIPPTLLVSSIGVMDDVRKAISLDAKMPGDFVYVLGEDFGELGGSEYFAMMGEQLRGKKFIGNNVPKVELKKNKRLYRKFYDTLSKGLVASAQSVNMGGLGVALSKTAMGGRLGMEVSLNGLLDTEIRDDYKLYSESQGRLVVTVNPEYATEFEKIMEGNRVARIGSIRSDDKFIIYGRKGKAVVETNVNQLLNSYKSTFRGY